jgi:protein TonB
VYSYGEWCCILRQWFSNLVFLFVSLAVHLLIFAALPAFPRIDALQHTTLQVLLADTAEKPAQDLPAPVPVRHNDKPIEQAVSTRKLVKRSPAPPSTDASSSHNATASTATSSPPALPAISIKANSDLLSILQSEDENSASTQMLGSVSATPPSVNSLTPEEAPNGTPEELASLQSEPVDLKAIIREYGSKVKQAIHSRQQYPTTAERLGQDGSVNLRFTVNADGSLKVIHIYNSSGYQELDQAARQAVIDASPFPLLPAELDQSELAMTITIHFNL